MKTALFLPFSVSQKSPQHLFLCLVLTSYCLVSSGHATSTQECRWHAAYFDGIFIGNYGSDAWPDAYINDAVAKANVIIRLDSLLKSLRREGKLEHFRRWLLIDHYLESYDYVGGRKVPGPLRMEGRKVWLCLTDSMSINKALKELWNIEDVIISPNKAAGMWLFSLHVGFTKNRSGAHHFLHGGDIYERPDSNLLWLKGEGGLSVRHFWHQHEIDGFYHQYTGLYLTRADVLQAQKLLLEIRDLKTTIVSHYVTPTIIRKYAY